MTCFLGLAGRFVEGPGVAERSFGVSAVASLKEIGSASLTI